MPVALAGTTLISQNSTRKVRYRVLRAQFGDGYEQTAPDGSNNVIEEWNVRWDNVSQTDRDTIIAMLDSAGGTSSISWTTPNGSAKLFKMTEEGYTEVQLAGGIYSISCNLREVFA